MPARPERKVRTCCCCIPTRAGAAMLAWLYFLCGILAVVLAVMILQRGTSDMEIGIKALVIAFGSLSALLVVTSAFGIIATIGQSPRVARIWSIMFQLWYFLQLALDIAVVALFFAKKLDSLIYECSSLPTKVRKTSSIYRDCERARNRLSLYYTLSGVVRNAIGFYFTRRVSSFTRHCAERVTSNPSHATPTQMSTLSGAPNQTTGPEYPAPYSGSADSLKASKV
ncbi:hypothetical protein RSOLAG22IIIB_02695 [Rhizoctonia solani]|uniref:Uncharacterized protein n=1 Tax=Rhizoctonia solani TaxID=456999 RepID=A0A0K6GHU7_9AGAM|nr:hypothetical protein RSOLAG22IIIB_02695 [Rhizoctonia solani]